MKKKNEKDSGRSRKMTPSCKGPISSFSSFPLVVQTTMAATRRSTERLPAIKIALLCILGPPLTVSCGSSTYSRLTFVLLMTFPLLTRPCSANVPVRVMVPV